MWMDRAIGGWQMQCHDVKVVEAAAAGRQAGWLAGWLAQASMVN